MINHTLIGNQSTPTPPSTITIQTAIPFSTLKIASSKNISNSDTSLWLRNPPPLEFEEEARSADGGTEPRTPWLRNNYRRNNDRLTWFTFDEAVTLILLGYGEFCLETCIWLHDNYPILRWIGGHKRRNLDTIRIRLWQLRRRQLQISLNLPLSPFTMPTPFRPKESRCTIFIQEWEDWRVQMQWYWARLVIRLAAADGSITDILLIETRFCLEFSFAKANLERALTPRNTPAGDALKVVRFEGSEERKKGWGLAYAIQTDGADPRGMGKVIAEDRMQACREMREVYIAATQKAELEQLNPKRLREAAEIMGVDSEMPPEWPGGGANKTKRPRGNWRRQEGASASATPGPTSATQSQNRLPPSSQTAELQLSSSHPEQTSSESVAASNEEADNSLHDTELTAEERREGLTPGELSDVQPANHSGIEIPLEAAKCMHRLMDTLQNPNGTILYRSYALNGLPAGGFMRCEGEGCYVTMVGTGWRFEGQKPLAARQFLKTVDHMAETNTRGDCSIAIADIQKLEEAKDRIAVRIAAEAAMMANHIVHKDSVSLFGGEDDELADLAVRLFATQLSRGDESEGYLRLRSFVLSTRNHMFTNGEIDNFDRMIEDGWIPAPNWFDTIRGFVWIEPLTEGGWLDSGSAAAVRGILKDCLEKDRYRTGRPGSTERPNIDLVDRCYATRGAIHKPTFTAMVLQADWKMPIEFSHMNGVWNCYFRMRTAVDSYTGGPIIPRLPISKAKKVDIPDEVLTKIMRHLDGLVSPLIRQLQSDLKDAREEVRALKDNYASSDELKQLGENVGQIREDIKALPQVTLASDQFQQLLAAIQNVSVRQEAMAEQIQHFQLQQAAITDQQQITEQLEVPHQEPEPQQPEQLEEEPHQHPEQLPPQQEPEPQMQPVQPQPQTASAIDEASGTPQSEASTSKRAAASDVERPAKKRRTPIMPQQRGQQS